MPINQFNDYPWQRRESAEGSDRYERELDRRVECREEEPRRDYMTPGNFESWRWYIQER